MLILAFDTTSPSGGGVLFGGGPMLAEVRAGGVKVNYSVALFEAVDRLLAHARIRLSEVDLFAAAAGPGSFTGIRVGLAAAQGWARAFNRPVRGVSVLEAMIEEMDEARLEACGPPPQIAVPLLDARRGEFYAGVYRRASKAASGSSGVSFELSGEGQVLSSSGLASLAAELRSNEREGVTFIARNSDSAARAAVASLQGPAASCVVSDFLPGAIARIAHRAALAGRLQQPRKLDAWYIRRSDAEVNWRG
jgi:tRNA threonylcarbamoyladenosine biosynthesis protein TsaB